MGGEIMKSTAADGLFKFLYRLQIASYDELSKLMSRTGYMELLVTHANIAFKDLHRK